MIIRGECFVALDLDFIKKEILILLMSMMPISEVRGAIPLGASLGVSPERSIILGILGNMFIVPILLIILNPLMNYLLKFKVFNRPLDWVKDRTLRKTRDKIRKYSSLGLFLFVAVPIPTTGAWTGCLAATLLKLDFKKSLLAIWGGVLASGLIVSIFTYHIIL